MHILITGAAGMVGRKLTARLVKDGALNGRAIEKLTPSTAKTVPPARCNRPVRIGKCFFNPLTSSTAGRAALPLMALASVIAATVEFLRAPAGGPMAREFLLIVGIAGATAVLGMHTARRKRPAHH